MHDVSRHVRQCGRHPIVVGIAPASYSRLLKDAVTLGEYAELAPNYGLFFSHLSLLLMDCDQQALTLGSDDELAMRQCMQAFFPRAALIVCTCHLQENVKRQLDERMGSHCELRRSLYNGVFGENGLTSQNDVITFDEATERFSRDILLDAPNDFKDYFEQRIRVLLRANVQAGRNEWTNNSAESINHVLKQFTQWKPKQLLDLIDKLRQLVSGQFVEADRAIVGRGDLVLAPSYNKHRLTVDVWSTMSTAQLDKASKACFRPLAPPSCASTDGSLTVWRILWMF